MLSVTRAARHVPLLSRRYLCIKAEHENEKQENSVEIGDPGVKAMESITWAGVWSNLGLSVVKGGAGIYSGSACMVIENNAGDLKKHYCICMMTHFFHNNLLSEFR